jgi:hypothetical protein
MKKEPPSCPSALEKAAKYICNQTCGRCPMAMEDYSCPVECSPETTPWRCWISYFSVKTAYQADDE